MRYRLTTLSIAACVALLGACATQDDAAAPNRLVAHGWGESRLKVPSDPGSGANRRVEVSLILPTYGELFVPSYDYIVPANGRSDGLYYQDQETWVWLPGGGYGLTDPRWRLSRYALDDFGATPTRPVRW